MKSFKILLLSLLSIQAIHAELFTEHFKDGVIKSQIEYQKGTRSDTEEGIKEGLEKVYYNSGELAFTVKNIAGKRDGEMHWYDRQGNHLEVIRYQLGKRHGLNQIFYDNGNLRIEVNYKNDHKEGVEKYFFSTGRLASKVNFVLGKKEGIQKEYNQNKTINNTVTYKHGYKEGLKQWFDEKGKVSKTEIYKMDRPIEVMKNIQEKKPEPIVKALQGLDFNPNNRKVD